MAYRMERAFTFNSMGDNIMAATDRTSRVVMAKRNSLISISIRVNTKMIPATAMVLTFTAAVVLTLGSGRAQSSTGRAISF